MNRVFTLSALLIASSWSVAHAVVHTGVMDNRTGFPLVPGFTAQSPAWATGGSTGGGLRLEWQADDESTPGSWTYTYRLIRGSARNKGFAFFDIETGSDFTAANIKSRQVVSANGSFGTPIRSGLSFVTISDPVNFNAVHDFSNAPVTEADVSTLLSKADLSHYSGDPGRVPPGQPGGKASATPSVGPVPHPFYGIRVTFPGSFQDLAYEASDWEFRIVSDRAPMWGSFFGWGDQTVISPYWYANFYNDNIDNQVRLDLDPANNTTGADPYRGWILVPGALPGVTATIPADGAGEVPFFEPINAVFNRQMDPTTITATTFTLSGASGSVSYDQAGKTATLLPDTPLLPSTTYTATITSAARDKSGAGLAQPKVWSFTTTPQDIVPPSVVTTGPVADAANVAYSAPITATFSETVDTGTLTPATFTLGGVSFAGSGSVGVTGTVSYNVLNRTASFKPAVPLAGGTTYIAAITTAVRDRSGNPVAATRSWSFTTLPDGVLSPGRTGSSVADALRALRIAMNLVQPGADDLRHGDVAPLGADGIPHSDGKIDVQDALVILRKALGIITW